MGNEKSAQVQYTVKRSSRLDLILKRDRQYNGQEQKNKRTNNDLQNITQKTKDQATRT
jgi:hypothetical protein